MNKSPQQKAIEELIKVIQIKFDELKNPKNKFWLSRGYHLVWDQKYYDLWENFLGALKEIASLSAKTEHDDMSSIIERSDPYDKVAKKIVAVIADISENPLKHKITENGKLEAQMEWEEYLRETIPTSL